MSTSTLGSKAIYYCDLDYNANHDGEIPQQIRDQLGDQRWEYDTTYGLKGYRFSLVAASSAAVANGTLVLAVGSNKGNVDTRVASSARNLVAGVGIGAIAAGKYGWIQNYGYHPAVITDGTAVALGDALVSDGSTNVLATKVAAGTAPGYKPLGYAVAASSGSAVAMFINVP